MFRPPPSDIEVRIRKMEDRIAKEEQDIREIKAILLKAMQDLSFLRSGFSR